jgi:hypothetical protein
MSEPEISYPLDSPETSRRHPKLQDPGTAPRIKELEVMVAEVIRETPDTSTLVLFTGNDRLDYQPGHFLTIKPQQFPALDRFCKYFEDMKGRREGARAYSLVSAPHEKHLAVTVKEERYVSGLTKLPASNEGWAEPARERGMTHEERGVAAQGKTGRRGGAARPSLPLSARLRRRTAL